MNNPDQDRSVDLSKANVLVIDASQLSLDIMVQILRGFGVSSVSPASTVEEAQKLVGLKAFDLIVVDPSVDGGAGYDFVNALRKSGGRNAYCPVILSAGHIRLQDVSRARDTGANFVITKPMAASVVLKRILWVARDKRPFVEVGNYVGPDRRFKFEGPPVGSDGRRESDLKSPLGDAQEPNLSNDEIESMFKPQRVLL